MSEHAVESPLAWERKGIDSAKNPTSLRGFLSWDSGATLFFIEGWEPKLRLFGALISDTDEREKYYQTTAEAVQAAEDYLKKWLLENGALWDWASGELAENLIAEPPTALDSVLEERARQNAKWGEQNHEPCVWAALLTEECGEFSEAALHTKFGGPAAANLREEAVHSAAMGLQIVEFLDRCSACAAQQEAK